MRTFVGRADRRGVGHRRELDVAAHERDHGVRDPAELPHADDDPLPPHPSERDAIGDVARLVVEGVADVVCGDLELQLQKGEHIHIPPETNHRLGNSGEGRLAIIEVQLGDYLGEDDIVRLEDDYQRVE